MFAGDRRTIELALESEEATLEILTEKANQWVEIMDVGRAQGSLKEKLRPEAYTIRVFDKSRSHERTVELAPGTYTRLQLGLPRIPLRKKPWFWVGIGAAVAGATIGGYYLIRPGTLPPRESDDVGGVIEALRSK